MSDGNNRLHQFLGITLDVTRDEGSAAWLAMQAKGKQKGRDLKVASRIRDAILDEQLVNEETGAVTWQAGTIKFANEDDFTCLAKAIDKMVDDDGVEFGLSTAALALQAKVDAIRENLKAQIKKAKEAAPTA